MIQIDKQATAARRFEHEKSRVLKDGREILHGADWDKRVAELRERSGGQCEALLDGPFYIIGERCRAEAADPDHIVKRSKGRDDRLNMLKALCREHHRLKHPEFAIRSDKRARREREAVKCG